MSIVTKTGDDGKTSAATGQRVEKSDPQIAAVGELDELNALIGLLRSKGADEFARGLQEIQNELFELGTGADMSVALMRLEKELYEIEDGLPELKNFILPGGHELAALAQLARTVCRRAERAKPSPYLNRLSDYLFLFARRINFATKTDEVIWKKI